MQKHTLIQVNDASLVSSTADAAAQENALFTSHNFSWEGTLHDLKQLPPNLGGWIQLFLRLQIKGIKSDRTFQAMDRDLRYFYDFFVEYLGNEIITSWTPQLTQRFMQSREETFNEKPATVSRRLRSLSIFANWVNSIRPEWFTLGHPTKGVKEPVQQALSPKGLTKPQVRLLIDAAHNLIAQKQIKKKSTRGRSTTIQRPYRDFAVLILMLNTGIRREEVCNLTREQFSATDKKLTNVKCKGNIVRNILLSKETVAAIETYFAEERPQDQAVFTETSALFLASGSRRRSEDQGKLSVRAINSIIAKLETEANAHLNPDKQFRVQPHTLRHTHAYHLLESGRDLAYIQKRLGHQSMQFLVRYTQMPEAQEAEMLDTIEFK
jgi:site-specific recombinase XerD